MSIIVPTDFTFGELYEWFFRYYYQNVRGLMYGIIIGIHVALKFGILTSSIALYR